MRALLLGLLAVLALQLMSDPAQARPPMIKGMWENLYYSRNPEIRQHWLGETVEADASLIRLSLGWKHVVGDQPPVNPRDPADPAYDFSLFDALVREANARGLRVLITVSGAPEWAEGANPPGWADSGTWRPDPVAYGEFAEALARRYTGSFVPDAAGPLPEVKLFEAWNEPNQDTFLAPQWSEAGLVGPAIYRSLLNAFYRGVKRGNPAAQVLGPATSPFGDDSTHSPTRVRPLRFIRELFCVNEELDPTNCPEPVRLDIVSHHPINFDKSPTDPPLDSDDLVIPNTKRIRPVVRAAQRAGNLVPGGRKPLWVTELWWITNPHDFGISPQRQAQYITEAFYRLWQQKVEALIWFELVGNSGFPSGLIWPDGRPKPGLSAFRFPFLADRKRNGETTAWGIPPDSGKLRLQRKRGGRWRGVESLQVTQGRAFTTELQVPRGTSLRAELGGERSRSWRAR
jgi:hypothetical protein